MKKIIKSRRFLTVALIIFAILLDIAIAIIYKNTDPTTSFLENIYFSSQIISSIFVISGVVIAVWQYYLSSKSAKTSLEITQVQRAIDLSEYYKDNILRYYPAIAYIFEQTGITKILDTVKLEQMIDFDSHELTHIFSLSQIEELKEIQKSPIFFKTVLEANDIYNLHLKIQTLKTEVENEKAGTTEITLAVNGYSVAVAFMSNLINRVLNNLEFFALHFKHNTADESVIYQSLHQSYFEIIALTYYYIAKNNNDSSNKLYTNVIWLFNNWRAKKISQNEEFSKKSRSIESHGTIIEK